MTNSVGRVNNTDSTVYPPKATIKNGPSLKKGALELKLEGA